jgi:hypothetical protein
MRHGMIEDGDVSKIKQSPRVICGVVPLGPTLEDGMV